MKNRFIRHRWRRQQHWWPFQSRWTATDGGVDTNVETIQIRHSQGTEYNLPCVGRDGDYFEVWHAGHNGEGWWRMAYRAEWRDDHWLVMNQDSATDCDGRTVNYREWTVQQVDGGMMQTLVDRQWRDQYAEEAGY